MNDISSTADGQARKGAMDLWKAIHLEATIRAGREISEEDYRNGLVSTALSGSPVESAGEARQIIQMALTTPMRVDEGILLEALLALYESTITTKRHRPTYLCRRWTWSTIALLDLTTGHSRLVEDARKLTWLAANKHRETSLDQRILERIDEGRIPPIKSLRHAGRMTVISLDDETADRLRRKDIE